MVDAYILLIPLLLLIAAIFAASEASLFSLSRSQLESIRSQKPSLYDRITKLIEEPDALLSTIIVGNECINILVGTLIVVLLQRYLSHLGTYTILGLSVVVTALLLLTASEILPKILAFRLPVKTASALALPISIAHTFLTPLRVIFLWISRMIITRLGIEVKPPSAVSEKDFLTLVEVGAETGSLETEEKELIFNVFSFSDLVVSSIMTPWKNVVSIRDDLPLDSILSLLREKRFSRIPVVSALDNRVVGILYAKELFKLLISTESISSQEAIRQATSSPYIVSAQKKVANMFRDFKGKKVHIALVVDEYGHHLGIVTLEDVLNVLLQTKGQKK